MSYDAPPPPPQSPYGGYPPPPPADNSNKPVWSLVCGILGILCCGLLGIPAIILGRQAAAEGQPGGMAKAGEVLGYVGLGLMVLGFILFAAGVISIGSSDT
jgi:drug/metabolite transporter (DMT)-like permease